VQATSLARNQNPLKKMFCLHSSAVEYLKNVTNVVNLDFVCNLSNNKLQTSALIVIFKIICVEIILKTEIITRLRSFSFAKYTKILLLRTTQHMFLDLYIFLGEFELLTWYNRT
jgi:hypothetical protein